MSGIAVDMEDVAVGTNDRGATRAAAPFRIARTEKEVAALRSHRKRAVDRVEPRVVDLIEEIGILEKIEIRAWRDPREVFPEKNAQELVVGIAREEMLSIEAEDVGRFSVARLLDALAPLPDVQRRACAREHDEQTARLERGHDIEGTGAQNMPAMFALAITANLDAEVVILEGRNRGVLVVRRNADLLAS